MDKLWQKRKPPTPLQWNMLGNESETAIEVVTLPDKRIWSIPECANVFQKCIKKLKERCKASENPLVWDKDDDVAMDFVAATANMRSNVFHIPLKSRFDIKSISGKLCFFYRYYLS